MTKDDFAALLEELATPIDFPDLVRRGILKKTGRGSYLLLKPSELPAHAWRQMSSMSQTKAGSKVTFEDTTKAARKLLTKISR
jgi:hypothetical protein